GGVLSEQKQRRRLADDGGTADHHGSLALQGDMLADQDLQHGRGRRRGKGTRDTRGEHAQRLRIGSIDILADRDGRTDDGQIQTVRKRGLADDPVHTRVLRQLGKPPGDLGPVSSRGQPVNLAVDTHPGGGCVDGPQIPGGPLVVGGDDRGQGRRYPPLAQESSQLGGPLRYGSGDGLAVDDAAHPGISCRTGKRISFVFTLRAWLVMRRHPHRPPGGKAAPRTGMITARYRSAMTGWPRSLPRATGWLALVSVPVISVISVSGAGHGAAVTLASPPSDASSWTVYHHDVAGT